MMRLEKTWSLPIEVRHHLWLKLYTTNDYNTPRMPHIKRTFFLVTKRRRTWRYLPRAYGYWYALREHERKAL